ncbi:MAG: recombinase family protein [Mycobacteriales bacterium]
MSSAALSGSVVVAERYDNDISAGKGGRPRPGYCALLDDVRGDRVDRVVVFHTSRLWRNREERAQAQLLVHSPMIVGCPDRKLDRQAADRSDLLGVG